MTQEERWKAKNEEVVEFVEYNKGNPSKYVDEERGKYYNRIRHNEKLLKTGMLKLERRELLEMMEWYKHANQYV